MKKVNLKDLRPSTTISSPLLPTGFIERVQVFKKVLAEVEKTTLEETILNFQRDQHPEKELEIWEDIASAYEGYIMSHPNLSPDKKRNVFSSFLAKTVGMEIPITN